MNPRLPYAAQQLVIQVRQEWPDVQIEASGLDGYGVQRKLRFDPDTSVHLHPVMQVIADRRILRINRDPDGMILEFVTTVRADSREPFPIPEALRALSTPVEKPVRARRPKPEPEVEASSDTEADQQGAVVAEPSPQEAVANDLDASVPDPVQSDGDADQGDPSDPPQGEQAEVPQ